MVIGLLTIGKHYHRVHTAVHVPTDYRPPRHTHYVVVLVGSVNKGAINAISYARSLAPDRLIAISVVGDAEEQDEVEEPGRRTTSRSSCTPSRPPTGS